MNRRILIAGGGLGGLRVAQRLGKKLDQLQGWEILLLDENDYHQYVYLVHQVASGRTKPSEIIVPFERLLKGTKVKFRQEKVLEVDPINRVVRSNRGPLTYDILVVALGSSTEYYGIKGLQENSLTPNSVEDAVEIRSRIEDLYAQTHNPQAINIVVGGGGAVGVELAAEVMELLERLGERQGTRDEKPNVILVEGLERLVPILYEVPSESVERKLRSLGVRIILNKFIVETDENYVVLDSGESIKKDLLVWTGGITKDAACGPPLEIDMRRLCIDKYSRAEGFEDIYIVGDSALVTDPHSGKVLPNSAHLTLQQADIVVKNVYAQIVGKPLVKFQPQHIGDIVSIGRDYAIGVLKGIRVEGLLARILNKLIHLNYVWSIGGLGLLLGGKGVGKSAAASLS